MNSSGTRKNLRPPWRKGEPSPNPSGRPKRLPISDTYARLLAQPVPKYIRRMMKREGIHIEPGATYADAVGQQIVLKAVNGDLKATQELRNAIEGRAGQRPADPRDNEPVNIHVVYDDERKNEPPRPGLDAVAFKGPDKS